MRADIDFVKLFLELISFGTELFLIDFVISFEKFTCAAVLYIEVVL